VTGTGVGYVEQISEVEFGPAEESGSIGWGGIVEAGVYEEEALFGASLGSW